MIFRNVTMFRFPMGCRSMFEAQPVEENASFELAEPFFVEGLRECQLKPVGPLELASRGFISPFGRDSDELYQRCGSALLLSVGGEDRLLPSSVVNDLLQKKLAEIEKAEGRKPGGRTRKRIKDELIVDLLPRAFIKPSRVDVLIDLELGVVAVDTSSRGTAEKVVSEIRRALGSFPALPVNAEVAPRAVLTGWVAGEPLPEGLTIGDEAELRDPMEQGAVVRCSRQELQGEEIGNHLEAGKQVTRLALTLNDHVSFVLGEDLVLRKYSLLDGALDQLENLEREDLRAELDARFALMAAEFRQLFKVLEPALKLSTAAA